MPLSGDTFEAELEGEESVLMLYEPRRAKHLAFYPLAAVLKIGWRIESASPEEITIQLQNLHIQTAAVLERVASLTLILAHGSQVPITLCGDGTAVIAGNAVWTEDESSHAMNDAE